MRVWADVLQQIRRRATGRRQNRRFFRDDLSLGIFQATIDDEDRLAMAVESNRVDERDQPKKEA